MFLINPMPGISYSFTINSSQMHLAKRFAETAIDLMTQIELVSFHYLEAMDMRSDLLWHCLISMLQAQEKRVKHGLCDEANWLGKEYIGEGEIFEAIG